MFETVLLIGFFMAAVSQLIPENRLGSSSEQQQNTNQTVQTPLQRKMARRQKYLRIKPGSKNRVKVATTQETG